MIPRLQGDQVVIKGYSGQKHAKHTYFYGVFVHYDGAEHFPNAYKHTPESTHFTAVFNGKCWAITELYRDACPNRTGFNAVVMLTDTAKMALVEAMEKIAC